MSLTSTAVGNATKSAQKSAKCAKWLERAHDLGTVLSSLADVVLDLLVAIEFYQMGDDAWPFFCWLRGHIRCGSGHILVPLCGNMGKEPSTLRAYLNLFRDSSDGPVGACLRLG